MKYEVHIGQFLAEKMARQFGEERSISGDPSQFDFFTGPLAAALERFEDFQSLPKEYGPAIRSFHSVDPVFGTVVFVGVAVEEGIVEIADFEADPGYWADEESDGFGE